MSSILEGYNYDVFISYRQKDNKHDGWVTKFVDNLKGELESTFKEDVSVYFDKNLQDRLQETHHVNKSLEGKLKCVVFIPILSQTYCDPNSYAWKHEFLSFLRMADSDSLGRDVKLRSGNVASRILPVRIHDLEQEDIKLFEKETGSVLRAMDFVFKTASGVNRPLNAHEEHPHDNLNKTYYNDQINKVAHAIKEIMTSLKGHDQAPKQPPQKVVKPVLENKKANKVKVIVGSILAIAIVALSILFIPKLINPQQLEKSIAVLPFDNFSIDNEFSHLGDAITDEIILQLQYIPEFDRILSRSSTMQYKEDRPSVPEIAQELGVNYIIEGSIQRQEDDISIRVQVIRAKKENHIWGKEYVGKWKDIQIIQDDIAKKVAEELKIVLSPEEIEQIDNQPTNNVEAYDMYLKGRYFYKKRTEQAINEAIEYYLDAIDIDTNYALAYVGLADCYIANIVYGNTSLKDDIQNIIGKSKQAALKALQIDNTLAEAYASLGNIAQLEWNWNDALEKFEVAIKMNPKYEIAHQWYASCLTVFMRHDESIAEAKLARELDPFSDVINSNVGRRLYFARRYDQAIEESLQTLTKIPDSFLAYWALGLAYLQKGMFSEAVEEMQKAVNYSEGNLFIKAHLGYIYGATGNYIKAKELLDGLIIASKEKYVSPVLFAIINIGLGENDIAINLIESAYELHSPLLGTQLVNLNANPIFDPLRSESRFQAIIKKLGLLEYQINN